MDDLEDGMSTLAYLRAASTIVLVLVASACKNPNYCEGNPGNNCNYMWDAPDSAACTSNDQCSGATPVCDVTGSQECVQCIEPDQTSACAGTTPVCGADHTCQACTMHAQCASNVCLPDGSCSDGSNVAYVAPSGSGNACTSTMPCGTLAAALAKNKPLIKFAAGLVKDTATTTIDGKAVTILAEPGAKLDRDLDGPILEVKSANADVRIYDLEITGASGTAGANGIDLVPNGGSPKLTLTRVKVTSNQGTGIAVSGGTLTVTQSTISDNTGGGVSISSAEFDLTNNVIAGNGGGSSGAGGIRLDINTSGMHRIDFNTIAANVGPMGLNTGIHCGTVLVPLVFSNNIIFGNVVAGVGKQIGGANCSATYSDIGPDTLAGTGNINMDPQFVNAAQGDYHLTAGSPCKDAADPAAVLGVDFDGDTRPQGSQRDMGADEYR